MSALESVLLALLALVVGYAIGATRRGPLIVVRMFNRADGGGAQAGMFPRSGK